MKAGNGLHFGVDKLKKESAFLNKRFQMVWPLLALLLVAVLLLWERTGVRMQRTAEATFGDSITRTAAVSEEADTLLIVDETNEISDLFYQDMTLILNDMRVSFETVDISEFDATQLAHYQKIVLCFSNLDLFGEQIVEVTAWVEQGGCMMNLSTYDASSNLSVIASKIGILEGGDDYVAASGCIVDEDFMIGAGGRSFPYGGVYWSSLNVLLDHQCRIYIRALENDLPLLWERGFGAGKFVVMNQSLTGKEARGFLASAYSLMDAVSVYPVINASAFYLDDFPSPVPSGNGKYIQEAYGMDISNFYANVWWKDLLDWEKRYGIIHTGLIVEDYSDLVKALFVRTESVERFSFFGKMLLNHGGELGFHGYNHMPLCLTGFDYEGLYDDYVLWETTQDMEEALQELYAFSSELFPEAVFQVYVPPSNIISEDGIAALREALPEIRAIASSYLPGECAYAQEFGVREDGIIETPRITSGAIMDDYMYLIAFSELNFHYVQSHFMHPDDVLDEDRGASLGWETMHENLEEYMKYIYQNAPNIEDVTGSGMAHAVETFAALSVDRTEMENGLALDIGGFATKASFMLCINDDTKVVKTVKGATIEQLTRRIYMLHAYDSHVEIQLGSGV